MLEIQKSSFAIQEKAINQQLIAIQRQSSHLRLYKIA